MPNVLKQIPLVVPASVQRKARIKSGDAVEFNAAPGVITIVSRASAANDGYTPAQRCAIDAQLELASQGPFYGPFETADQAIQFARREVRARKGAAVKTRKPPAR